MDANNIDSMGDQFTNRNQIWTDKEAILKQYEQTKRSACGASGIINVLVNT